VDRQLGSGSTPHYQVRLAADGSDYRIAVNVKSQQSPSELLYLIVERYAHPVLDGLTTLPNGFTELDSRPGGLALDYIRANLFAPRDMIPLPFDLPGPDNDLNERIDAQLQRALAEPEAVVYAFGQRWGPEPNDPDRYFGFEPGNGIHDIHMNQGNSAGFQQDNGVWQDGGVLLHLPSEDRWVAIFLAFQSQCWHTGDADGFCLDGPERPAEERTVVIVAATVNPAGADPGLERVLLLNTLAAPVSLDGWALADKNKRRHGLEGSIGPGAVTVVPLPGSTVQLSNEGGIITLLDPGGVKVHGVQYGKAEVSEQGRTIAF
jgi:uncharacterized protein YukJ